MHLRDASIDLDGHPIAVGRLEIPPPDAGWQGEPPATHQRLRILLPHGVATQMGVVPCHDDRNPETGFFPGREDSLPTHLKSRASTGLDLSGALAHDLVHVLRRGGRRKTVSDGDEGTGRLIYGAPNAQGRVPISQGLSDLRMEAEVGEDQACTIRFSAALHAAKTVLPIPPYPITEGDAWAFKDGAPQRLIFTCVVDASTRAALFGAWDPARDPSSAQGPPLDLEPGTAARPRLAGALVGRDYGSFSLGYGVDAKGSFVGYCFGTTSFSLTEYRSVSSDLYGLADGSRFGNPRFVLSALGWRDFRVGDTALRGADLGYVDYGHPENGPGPDIVSIIVEARIDVRPEEMGLAVAFDARVEQRKRSGPVVGVRGFSTDFRVPWANLILHRSEIWRGRHHHLKDAGIRF